MARLIREIFFLRRGERRALVFIIVLLTFTVALKVRVGSRTVQEHRVDTSFYESMRKLKGELAQIMEQEAANREQNGSMYEDQYDKHIEELVKITPFPFNPNTVPEDSLHMMNLSGFVTRNLIRYRNAGGTFRKAEDLKKIYGMDSATYVELAPYIRIRAPRSHDFYPEKRKWDSVPVIGLNSADSVLLMKIPGIGPSYSRRIIKYREMLGGYHDVWQLWEVYGMDSVRFKALKQYCVLDTQNIKRLALNKASFRDLISHPYISRSETYAILQYLDFADSITSIEELSRNQVIEEERLRRVAPYLCIGENED
ncbi:MAG: helix-hairpin-helix domain-containing protein [Bacteroidales bacterium]|nr:helix-hairpin-helix domain-containing protein [Bacteroidales bacterium]